ncbi:MAG: hypothetical protein AAGD14_17120 [Planctomycetota bacterium]
MRRALVVVLACFASARADDVDELIAGLARGTSEERRALIAELARRGSAILPRVEPVMRYDMDHLRRAAAADVLAAMGAKARSSVGALLKMARDPKPEPRIAALQALAAIRPQTESARRTLKSWIEQSDGVEEAYAYLALFSIRNEDEAWFREQFSDRVRWQRAIGRARRLGSHGEPILARLLRQGSPFARRFVLTYFSPGETPPGFWIRLLEERVEQDADAEVVTMACFALAHYNAPTSRAFARRQITQKAAVRRALGCVLLGRGPTDRGDRRFVAPRVRDADPVVQVMALRALRRWAAYDAAILEDVRALRAAKFDAVREQAALLLVEAGARDEWALQAITLGAMRVSESGWKEEQPVRNPVLFSLFEWPDPKRWSLRAIDDVLARLGPSMVSHVAKHVRHQPTRAIPLLARLGPKGWALVDEAVTSDQVEARVTAMLVSIEADRGRSSWGGALVRDLYTMARRGSLHAERFEVPLIRLGDAAAAGMVEEARRHLWFRIRSEWSLLMVIARSLASMEGRAHELLGPPIRDGYTWVMGSG